VPELRGSVGEARRGPDRETAPPEQWRRVLSFHGIRAGWISEAGCNAWGGRRSVGIERNTGDNPQSSAAGTAGATS